MRKVFTIAVTVDLIAMMVLTFVDVVGRYLFSAPLAGAKELTEMLMGFLVFAAAPIVTADRGHITTALFETVLPHRALRVRNAIIAVVVAIASAVLAWRLWVQAGIIASLHTGSQLLGVPIAPLVYFMAITAGACAFIVLGLEFRALAGSTTAEVRHAPLDAPSERAA